MKRFAPYIGAAYLICLLAYIRLRTGTDYRWDVIVALIGPYAALSVLLPLYERYVRGRIDASDPKTVADLREADPDFDEFMDDRTRVNERCDHPHVHRLCMLPGVASSPNRPLPVPRM